MIHDLRQLPPIHELQRSEEFLKLLAEHSLQEDVLTLLLQEQLQAIREEMLSGKWTDGHSREQLTEIVLERAGKAAQRLTAPYLRRMINATGTVLHTNLGRARLSAEAIAHVTEIASSYSNVEYNIDTGKRGSRHDVVEQLLCRITGAEAAMVVNNNAAAVYLVLRTLASGKEVVVSRGQLVEIGGSFRISSIMEESGAVLKEIGTTNKTHLYDYERAINEKTAMLMKVHTSNFKIVGFTKSVATEELIALRHEHEHVLYYEDLGSGDIFGYRHFGIGDEPVVREVIEAGADLVSFSGDKLLGGPQAGIIAGKRHLIAKLKTHQLARVLRVDKMTLAALESTLSSYAKGEAAVMSIPAVRDILEGAESIRERAQHFIEHMEEHAQYRCQIEKNISMVGGGTMPDAELPTYVVAVEHFSKGAAQLAEELRKAEPPVIGRIQQEQLLLDFRTVREDEMEQLIAAFEQIV